MNNLIISLIILIVGGFCFYFLPDHSGIKTRQMIICRAMFVLSLIAVCFFPLPIPFFPHWFSIIFYAFCIFVMGLIFALILMVIAWIFGTTAGKISDKIIGIKD